MREILNLDFDGASFVANIEKAINVTTELDNKLKDIATDSNKVSFNKPISELNKLKGLLSEGGNLEGFDQIFKEFDKNIPKVKAYIAELKKYLATVTNKDEYKSLNAVIAQTEAAIKEVTGETKQLAKETENATKKQTSLRTEIRQNTIQLQQLERQGKQNTKEYKQLSAATSELIDMQGDLQGALKKAASDTYKIDLGLEGVQLGIGAYQTYLGVLALVGDESKELQEVMTKLLAVQQVAQGVQQIATFLTNKEGLALELKSKWTALSTFATNGATVAQRAFNTALVASGIGAFVVALGLLVANWDKVTAAITGVTKEQERYNDALKVGGDGAKEAQQQVIEVGIAFERARSGALSKNEALKIYNETLGETLGMASSLEEAERIYSEKTDAYVQASIRRAAAQKLIESAAQKRIEAEVNTEVTLMQRLDNIVSIALVGRKEIESQIRKENRNEKLKDSENDKNLAIKFYQESDAIIQKLGINFNKKEKEVSRKGQKDRVEKRKQHSLEFNNVVDKEYKEAIDKAIKYYSDLNDISDKAQSDLEDKRIANLQDTYTRESSTLDKFRDEQKKALEKAVKENEENLLNFISVNPDKKEEAEKRIKDFAETAKLIQVENEIDYQNKKLEINKKYLDLQLQQIKDNSNLYLSELDKTSSEEVLMLSKKYADGLISEEKYQEELAKIEQKYANKKRDTRLSEIDKEIKAAEDRLNLDPDNTKIEEEINKLVTERNKILIEANQKNQVNQGNSLFAKIFGLDPNSENFNEEKQKILTGLRSMVDSAISIIREQTAAEIEAYDTAIRLQQERVNQAQKIADNGNAEYLQMEEERLKELEQKREAAAQRQLEIDAALQASQMLVAIAGAAAQIAQGGIGNVIAGIATITATVAAGFALLNQLNSSRPRFFEGTETTVGEELGKPHRSGRDGYDISVDGSEMIVNGKITKELRKRGVKASDLPTLVSLGQNRINQVGMAVAKVEAKESFQGIEKRLEKSEKIQKQMLGALKTIKVAANIDREGVASIVSSFEMDKLKSSKA